MRITPDNIVSLVDGEVFVFGSNKEGQHLGGAARFAHQKLGAVMGVGIGMTGQCYAIPTMDGDIEEIRTHVQDFVKYAASNPKITFLVTEIGCGIAGWTPEEIAPLFADSLWLDNIALPQRFVDVLREKKYVLS